MHPGVFFPSAGHCVIQSRHCCINRQFTPVYHWVVFHWTDKPQSVYSLSMMDIWIVSSLRLLWIKLLGTVTFKWLSGNMFSFLTSKYVGVEFLDHMFSMRTHPVIFSAWLCTPSSVWQLHLLAPSMSIFSILGRMASVSCLGEIFLFLTFSLISFNTLLLNGGAGVVSILFYFLATLCYLQDLSSPTWDWTRALSSPNHWTVREGSPASVVPNLPQMVTEISSRNKIETSLVARWLRPWAPNAGGLA